MICWETDLRHIWGGCAILLFDALRCLLFALKAEEVATSESSLDLEGALHERLIVFRELCGRHPKSRKGAKHSKAGIHNLHSGRRLVLLAVLWLDGRASSSSRTMDSGVLLAAIAANVLPLLATAINAGIVNNCSLLIRLDTLPDRMLPSCRTPY